MSYDLTDILTTISAASASIVAILGGFIASKLITISGERSGVLERIKQINEELSLRIAERDKLKATNDEDDALDFIDDHFEELIKNDNLDNVYANVDHPNITLEVLRPYWEKAKVLIDRFVENDNRETELNDDYIPKALMQTVKDDEFGYQILLKCGNWVKKQIRESKRSNNRFDLIVPDLDAIKFRPAISSYSYEKNKEIMSQHDSAISMLELYKKQCEEQIQTLKKPRGMGLGLLIFALFTLFCIIAPLIFCPLSTENYKIYVIAKSIFLTLFGIGLISIFGYLLYLLKWNNNK